MFSIFLFLEIFWRGGYSKVVVVELKGQRGLIKFPLAKRFSDFVLFWLNFLLGYQFSEIPSKCSVLYC